MFTYRKEEEHASNAFLYLYFQQAGTYIIKYAIVSS
jgi:hypothetical protein